ncbi:winged helix-turn-helix transcriptional regulator [Promicromonospora sp. NPDC059942]|uniref:winged helix-turn-helix transcriptional regulator n=1 Tax=Promicromonospora sp. NPDC059942 TaxID=3347009 RepID=UPI003654AF22
MTDAHEPALATADGSVPRCATAEDRDAVGRLFRRVGDRWSLVVIARLRDGPVRFTTLLRGIDGISHRLLTVTLNRLADDGLVSRQAFAEVPPRVEYALTERGVSLLGPVGELAAWAERRTEDVSD